MRYTTFDKKVIDFGDIDHQHLSNIYWYNKVCLNRSDLDLSHVTKSIDLRFNGIVLTYRPLERFKDEIRHLDQNGMLIWNFDKTKADVIFRDEIVGIYETESYIRDLKIREILDDK